jgi:hypothetical protein
VHSRRDEACCPADNSAHFARHRRANEGIIMVFAYLDPAAGGMVIQTLVAAAVALPFILRSQLTRGLNRLRGRRPEPKPDEAPTESD